MTLLYHWLACAQADVSALPYRQAIEAVIDQMHQHFNPPWKVHEMANSVHMGVRQFRQSFHDVTGQSPKAFYDQLRMTVARELLLQQQYSMAQIAFQLGYSSPFHFSREFRRHFGVPPSKLVTGLKCDQDDNMGA